MKQNFYDNFFTISDEDIKKGLIYLDGFPALTNDSFNALTNFDSAPKTYVIKKGNRWADILFANSLNLVISEKFKELFENFKGVDFFPVNILSKDLLTLDVNYFNMVINGKCGKIISELSRKELATRIVGGPVFVKKLGLYFDPNSWNQSDFFVPQGTSFTFTTKKVKEIIEENELTNVSITPISEVENFAL